MAAGREFLLLAFPPSPAPVFPVHCYCNRTRSASGRRSSEQEHLDPAVSHSSVLVDMQPDSDTHRDLGEAEAAREEGLSNGRRRRDTATWPMSLLCKQTFDVAVRGWGSITDLP